MGERKATGRLRIIGGEWRGRKLPIADLPGLRPSTDRIRETLFNWLAPEIVGARCLDLFAGTGALGLEALSRGAADCQFVERQSEAAGLLEEALRSLDATARARVRRGNALKFLEEVENTRYDLVFLDPPFASELMDSALNCLSSSALLKPDAFVYLEYAPSQSPEVPNSWEQYRSKKSGGVIYELYRAPKH